MLLAFVTGVIGVCQRLSLKFDCAVQFTLMVHEVRQRVEDHAALRGCNQSFFCGCRRGIHEHLRKLGVVSGSFVDLPCELIDRIGINIFVAGDYQQSLSSSIARTGFELFGIGLVTFVLVNGAESLDGADA